MTTKPQSPENQPKADERNIVSLDSSYEGASFEDQLFLFWHNYKKVVIGACVLVALAFAGWGLIRYMQDRREQQIASEFQEAVSMDEITAFAERNSPHPLAGVAYLEVADYHFSNKEYEEAAQYYDLAAQDVGEELAGRAKIGHGVSLALAGLEAEALAKLEEIARDPANFSSARAEAYYHAATLAIELEQPETARDHIAKIGELENSQLWASRARGLEQALPEAPEEEPAPAAEEAAEAS